MDGGTTITSIVTAMTALAQTVTDQTLAMLAAIIPVGATAIAAILIARRGKGLVKSLTR